MACIGLQSIVEGWDCGNYPKVALFQEACWYFFSQVTVFFQQSCDDFCFLVFNVDAKVMMGFEDGLIR